MKNIFGIIIVIALGIFIYNKLIKYPYRYVGYFYPNINNLDNWIESEPLRTVEKCREWVDETADEYADYMSDRGKEYDYNFDYECGKNCYKGDPYYQGVTYTCHTSVD